MFTNCLDFGLHFGSVLGPFWLPKLIFFEAKIALISSLPFEPILAPFWEPFFIICASKIVPESEKEIL